MQTVLPSEFKRGMVLMLAGVPQVVEEFHISGTAQTKPKAVPTLLGSLLFSTLTWKSWSRSSSPPAKKFAWTQPSANMLDAKARGRSKDSVPVRTSPNAYRIIT